MALIYQNSERSRQKLPISGITGNFSKVEMVLNSSENYFHEKKCKIRRAHFIVDTYCL